MEKVCIDCVASGVTTHRPAPYPGPRCFSHWQIEKLRQKKRKAEGHVARKFGITGEQYDGIFEEQGGQCAICHKAKGISKRLCVDHDHKECGDSHPPDQGCINCIRGLLCHMCNHDLLGRYDEAALERALEYLRNPPAKKVLLGKT